EKAILKTKYGKQLEWISFQDVLERYYGKPLMSNRETEIQFLMEREAYFQAIRRGASSVLFVKLLNWIENTKQNRFLQLYRQDKTALTEVLEHLENAFSLFPLEDFEYLAVFSSHATGD